MKVRECLEKYYPVLCSTCRNLEQVIYDSKTCEDILNDIIISAIRKYADKDMDEEELFQNIKKQFLLELKFSWKRRGAEKLVYFENLNFIDKGEAND